MVVTKPPSLERTRGSCSLMARVAARDVEMRWRSGIGRPAESEVHDEITSCRIVEIIPVFESVGMQEFFALHQSIQI